LAQNLQKAEVAAAAHFLQPIMQPPYVCT